MKCVKHFYLITMSDTAGKYRAQGFGREFAWMDLANSLEWNGFGKTTDHLENQAWVKAFFGRWNLGVAPKRGKAQSELVKLRTLVRRWAEEYSKSQTMRTAMLAELNHQLNVPVRRALVQRQNGFAIKLIPKQNGLPWALSQIAASFAEMVGLRQAERLKSCPDEGCRWIFFDQTKGNTRRWCNDRTCGNRDRVRRARALAKNSD